MRTCGDYGGRNVDGSPCGRQTKGRCRYHPEGKDALGDRKKAFLEALEEEHTMEDAAAAIGVSLVAVWKWRRGDPEFNAQVKGLKTLLDDVAYDRVKGTLYKRIVAGQATGMETVFWLINRSRIRGDNEWRNTNKVEIEGRIGMYAAIARMPENEVQRILGLPRDEQATELARVLDPHGAMGLLAAATNGSAEDDEEEE